MPHQLKTFELGRAEAEAFGGGFLEQHGARAKALRDDDISIEAFS